MRRRCRLVVGTVLALGAIVTTHASATWSAQGSGSAGAVAATMPVGAAPSAVASGSTVTVRWPAATFADGTAVAGYLIARYNVSTGATAVVTGSCAGTVTATTCTETVPSGTWTYTDTPVHNNWTGQESSGSHSITV
jgi:hypothetical protein